MISNVRLRAMLANPENKWASVKVIYDGPSLEEALTHAVRGFHNFTVQVPWVKNPRGVELNIPGISFSQAMSVYNAYRKGDKNAQYTLMPGLRIDITVRGQG